MLKIKQSELGSFIKRCKYLYHIRSEDNKLVTYNPNEAQLKLNAIKQDEFERSKQLNGVERCKIILLKSRQIGGTTDTAVFNLDTMLNLDYAYGLVLAHDDKSTSIIYEKYKLAFNNLPDVVEVVDDNGNRIDKGIFYQIKPNTESYTGFKMQFSDKTKSRLLVRTAGAGDNVGRGDTLNFVHLCIHKDGLIILSDGSTKRIEDVKIGDKVITSSGQIAPISNKWFTGQKQTINIETWLSDTKLPVTKEHKVLTQRGYVQAGELTKEDYIQLPNIKFSNEIKEYKGIKLDYNFGYFLGYYLAEGHINKKLNRIIFAYCKGENYIDKIIDDFSDKFTSHKTKERKNSKTVTTTFYGSDFTKIINEICGRVENKNIPEWFFKTNEDFIKGVVVAYLSGDGSKTQAVWKKVNSKKENKNKKKDPEFIYNSIKRIESGEKISDIAKEIGFTYQGVRLWIKKHKNKTLEEISKNYVSKDEININYISATSIHETITRQLRRLIIGLNVGVPSIKYYTNKKRYDKKTKNIYLLLLSGQIGKYFGNLIDGCNIEGNLQLHSNRYKLIDNKWFVKIKSISDYELADTYDIEVNHEDHNFETPIGIVSNSEFASYDYATDVLTSINQSLPKTAFNYAIIESTANGISGKGEGFYELWKKSTDEWDRFKSGKTNTFEGYRPVFISWFELQKYRLDLHENQLIDIESVNFGSPENKKRFLDTEEQVLEEVFKDNRDEGMRAINWYRWCVKENCNYDYARARREYPTFPEDAFLSTDMSFFDTGKLFFVLNQYESKEPESVQGFLEYNEYGDLEFFEDMFGELKIWEKPDKQYMNRYVVSCLPEKEEVLTKEGLKEIQNVSINDELVNQNGEYVKINQLKRNFYKGNLIKLNTYNIFDGNTFTSNHPILASNESILKRKAKEKRYWEHNFKFINADDLKIGDWIKIPNLYRKKTLSNDEILLKWVINKREDFRKDNPLLDEDFWWFVGMWLAEGWIGKSSKYNKNINTAHNYYKEYKYAEKIKNIFEKYGCSVNIKKKKSTYHVKFSHNELVSFLKDNFSTGAENKNIPEWVKFIPENFKWKLLQGYLEGDGCVRSQNNKQPTTEIVSISKKLLNDFQDILFSMGIISSVDLLRNEGKIKFPNREKFSITKKTYRLRLGKFETNKILEKLYNVSSIFEREIKNRTSYFSDDFEYIYLRISEVNISYTESWVYNFDCETHTFNTRNFSTHNCDPSYGVEGGDYSCMFVFDRLEQKFVAKWYGNLKEDLVAEELLKLAYYYNEALVVPEMNLNTVLTLIKPDGLMPYTGEIYQRFVKTRGVEEYGYHTLGNTRKALLDVYESWLREDYRRIPDIDSLKEHISFIKKKGNTAIPKYEAAEGKHDDQVIAMALCIMGHNWWEEEVFEMDEDKNDISKIFITKPERLRRSLRISQLGLEKNKETQTNKRYNQIGT